MNAKELRIGNWLQNAKKDDFFEVTANDIETIFLGYSGASGIPLTEEWLLKLGFERTYNDCWMTMGFIHPNTRLGFSLIGSDDYLQCHKTGVNLKYVHQLQNLYFALTGQELTINATAWNSSK